MHLIQFIIFAFIAFVIYKVFSRFKEKNLTLKELVGWIFFWLAVAAIIALPQSTGFFAKILGVGRGTDVVIYLSIVVIFYIIFKIQVRFEKIEREITKIVRDNAINDQ